MNSMKRMPPAVLKKPPLRTPLNGWPSSRMARIALSMAERHRSTSAPDRNGSLPDASVKQPIPPVPGPVSPSCLYG